MTAIPNILTIVGNLTADPELRFTQDGTAVANFSVASTPRVSDGNGGFKDGETVFWRVSAWRKLGENVAATFKKGDRVLLVGEAKNNSYEKDGQTITTIQIDAKEVAASVEWATAVITRNAKGTSQTPPAQYAQQPQAQAPAQAQPQPQQQQYAQQPQQQFAGQAPAQPAYAGQAQPQQFPQQPQGQPAYAGQPAAPVDVDFS